MSFCGGVDGGREWHFWKRRLWRVLTHSLMDGMLAGGGDLVGSVLVLTSTPRFGVSVSRFHPYGIPWVNNIILATERFVNTGV